MQLDQQQQQKGLFTFYREQADLEDQLKSKRRLLKHSQPQSNQNKEIKPSHSYRNKLNLTQSVVQQQKKAESKMLEPRDKLMDILRKYNGKQGRKRQNLKIILQSQQQLPHQDSSHLKNRLQQLQGEQQSGDLKVKGALKASQQASKFQSFGKKQLIPRVNPFQKLAIIPTNFYNYFQDQLPQQIPRKKSFSRQKSLANNQFQSHEKGEANIQSFGRYELKSIREVVQKKKVNLPRIEYRANSQVINRRNKIKLQKIGERSVQKVQTQRVGKKPEISILLESVRLTTDCSTAKIQSNKIHSLFIENKQRSKEGRHKEMVLSDVLKRLQFS